MAQILPRDLTPIPGGTINPAAAIIVDNGDGVFQGTPSNVVDAGAPVNTQPEAEAGLINTGRMSPLRVSQAIAALGVSQAVLAAPTGGEMVGTTNGNAQTDIDALYETASSLLDLSTIISVTTATELDADALNKTIYVSGSTSFPLNLPPVSAVGQALKLVCARNYTGKLTVQAAADSGVNVDGSPENIMLAGESATFVYQGADGWLKLDAVYHPICAELVRSGSAVTLAVDAFTDIPLVAGDQLMNVDLSTLWLAGGYFTAPRDGIYAFDLHFWLDLTDGPGPVDVGFYIASSGGGSPGTDNFDRFWIGGASNIKIAYASRERLAQGSKLFPALRLIAPITAGEVTALVSRMVVSEVIA